MKYSAIDGNMSQVFSGEEFWDETAGRSLKNRLWQTIMEDQRGLRGIVFVEERVRLN